MERSLGGRRVYVAVISARRPQNVAKMTELVGAGTWYVSTEDDAKAYREATPLAVAAGALCAARNLALEHAFAAGLPCLQLSDDLRKLEEPVHSAEKQKYVAAPLSFEEAVTRMYDTLHAGPAYLAGVAPTANPFYFRGKFVSTLAFVVGDMILVKPCTLRFDESLRLKEDYDYTLQHLQQFGMIVRREDVLATFAHRSNSGGAVSYRTPAEEQAAIARLREKWGARIRDNPRRPNEILLRLK